MPFWWMSLVVVALVVGALGFIRRADAAARSRGLALHGNQSVWGI